MTAQGITRERDRWSAAGRSTIGIDATPLTGTWKILHPKATGIVGLDATLHDGRLLLWIIETDESGTQETGTLLATPLSSAVDSDQAMGLLASGELGPPASAPDGHALWLPQSRPADPQSPTLSTMLTPPG